VELKGYLEAMERVALKDGLRFVMAVSELGNGYLQAEQPWVLIKSDPARCGSVIAIATNLVRLLVSLCDPFMPSFSDKVREQLKLPQRPRLPETFVLDNPVGHKIGVPAPLFKKIENEELENWKARFSPCTFEFDIRTGQVVKVEPHPSADRLYLVDVSVGKETRSVVAGLKEHYTVEQLLNQPCLLLCNLKAATIQGAKSHGMLLVAAPKAGPMRLLQLADTKLPLGSAVLPAVISREHPEEVVPFILAVKPNLDLKKDFQKLDFRTVDESGEIHLVSEEQKPAMASKIVVLVCKTSPAVRAKAPAGTPVGAQVK
jgi:methionine--tRNA ligase beta chain